MSDYAKGSIRGHCPMGCGETLFIGSGGYVTCSLIGCPKPGALAAILDVREHEHIVRIGEGTFTIEHPLRERVEGELFDCGLHNYLSSLDGPPRQPGRYRAAKTKDGWSFSAVPFDQGRVK